MTTFTERERVSFALGTLHYAKAFRLLPDERREELKAQVDVQETLIAELTGIPLGDVKQHLDALEKEGIGQLVSQRFELADTEGTDGEPLTDALDALAGLLVLKHTVAEGSNWFRIDYEPEGGTYGVLVNDDYGTTIAEARGDELGQVILDALDQLGQAE